MSIEVNDAREADPKNIEYNSYNIIKFVGASTTNLTQPEAKKMLCCCEKNLTIMTNMWKELKTMNATLNALSLVAQSNDSLGVCQMEIPKARQYQDLKKLNKDLGKSADLYTKLSRRLGLIGGKDAQETTRNILSALISHELSLNYELFW